VLTERVDHPGALQPMSPTTEPVGKLAKYSALQKYAGTSRPSSE